MDQALFIHRCLELAERGRGRTGINPMVGGVLVRKGKIIAEGFHEEFGGPHAEANLIKKLDPTSSARGGLRGAGQKIEQEDGLYLNLEPCCHREKKTPPCTEIIIKSGIKHVITGMLDPNPQVAGKGIEELRNGGIDVIGPIERARCEWFNRGFVSLMKKGRPWVTMKRAQTLQGAIACDDGSRMKITNADQDSWSHQYLRAAHDAILVGVGTVVSDDPQLTCRIQNAEFRKQNYQPLRIILDSQLRIPLSAKIVNGEMGKGTMVVMKDSNESEKKMLQLRERGVRIIRLPLNASGVFDLQDLFQVLTTPTKDFCGITSVLVEGGARTWEAFRRAKMVDLEVTLIGTK